MNARMRLLIAPTAMLLGLHAPAAATEERTSERVIADFEGPESLAGNVTTHKATVTTVEDVPGGGGRFAAKTLVQEAAGTDSYFGTGLGSLGLNLSGTQEIQFWIKTDMEGRFSFQVQSGKGRASTFRFSTEDSQPGRWQQITAPLDQFNTPPWAKAGADWASIRRWQVTAFGSGPYDGKYIVLDNVVGIKSDGPAAQTRPAVRHPAAGAKLSNITLTEIDGRHWLVDPGGKPFFAHGITHVGNARARIDLAGIAEACRKLGFNAYGYGCPPELRTDMPYIESWNHLVPVSSYRGDGSHRFVDVFDPDEQTRIDKGVRENCNRSRGNPNCIGYCWTDLGTWPLENSTGRNWVEFIRTLPDDAPGRQAWQKFLATWKGADIKARDQAFLRLIAREYFRVIGEANRKYDPDHLIFGDRFAFNTLDSDVIREMLPWVDAIAIQPPFWPPFPRQRLDEVHELTGKPILLCDFAVRFKDGDKDVRNWKLSQDSVAAGRAYTEYVKAALNTDYVIGVFWCNPVDTPKGFSKPGVKQGFFADGLTERPGLHQAVKELNRYRDEITPEG